MYLLEEIHHKAHVSPLTAKEETCELQSTGNCVVVALWM